MVYEEDWYIGTANLNGSGARHLDGIIRRLGTTGAPVRVEPSGSPELDALRRLMVTDALIRAGMPPAEAQARVVLGGTRAEGLRYDDIEAVYVRGRIIGSALAGGYGGFGGGGYGGFR